MQERKTHLQQLDYTLLFLLFLLMCISLLSIYSAAMAGQYFEPSFFVKRQIAWFIIGSILMLAAMVIDYDLFKNFTIPLYVVGLILLLIVEFYGIERNGSQRWIGFEIGTKEIMFQPSEFVKIFLVLSLAHLVFLITKDQRERSFKEDWIVVAKVVAVGFPPFFLILIQPDLGTALVIASIMATMLLMAGISWKIFALLGSLVGLFLTTLVWLHNNFYDFFIEHLIKPHQLRRIYGWLDPESDPGGMGYQLLNAVQGIGSGQLYGKGYTKGVLSKSGYVPEIHTDFIFTVIGEEFGFLGATVLIVIYFLLFYRMIIIAFSCNNIYGSYLVSGVIGLLVFQIFQNIGMTIGLMPITGLALPFISYGGSALVTNMIAIGIVLNVNIRTRHYMFSSEDLT